jgi:hypothetical protein
MAAELLELLEFAGLQSFGATLTLDCAAFRDFAGCAGVP